MRSLITEMLFELKPTAYKNIKRERSPDIEYINSPTGD